MESMARQPVSMTSSTQPPAIPPLIASTTLPVGSKVQFADEIVNKPTTISSGIQPPSNNSSVTTTANTVPAAASVTASSPLVNSTVKPTSNNSISSVNLPLTSGNHATTTINNNNTITTNIASTAPAANVKPPESKIAAAPIITTTARAAPQGPTTPAAAIITNSPPAPINTAATAPLHTNNTSSAIPTKVSSPAISASATTSTTNSATPSTGPPVTNGQSSTIKTDSSVNQSMHSASSTGSGKSGAADSGSASKEGRSGTEGNKMNGSVTKGSSGAGPTQFQDQQNAASKQSGVSNSSGGGDTTCNSKELSERAGLCAPANKDSFPGSITSVLSTPPAARPNTAESVVKNSGGGLSPSNRASSIAKAGSSTSGGTSAAGATAKSSATAATTREPRPSTATPHKTGTAGAHKTAAGAGSTPVASRTSTTRIASAKVSPTSPGPNTISNGKSSTPAAATNGNGHCDDKSNSRAKSAPKLRPTSSLYKSTASSTLKGIASPSTQKSAKSLSAPNNNKSTRPKMGDAAGNGGGSGESKAANLKEQFAAFSRFGDTSSDGKQITLSQCDKWMKQAHVIDGKKITTTDTSILFKKLFKTSKKVGFEDFKKYVEELTTLKKMEPPEISDKLTNCGAPGLSSATRASGGGVYERLTDTSRYTGSHKERFDSTGKGRGIEGRRDVQDDSGYTASFKSKLAESNSPPAK